MPFLVIQCLCESLTINYNRVPPCNNVMKLGGFLVLVLKLCEFLIINYNHVTFLYFVVRQGYQEWATLTGD